MNTTRFLRSFALRGVLGVALTAATAFGVTQEELNALRAKAETGNGIAQYNLGLHYATVGESIADPVEAYVWLNLAADNGSTGRALVLLNSQMNQEQVREGKRRLEERRQQLANRKASGANSPLESSPIAAPSSPIAAVPRSPIGESQQATPDTSSLQAELQKMSAELAAAWKENDQLKDTLAAGKSSASNPTRIQELNDELGKARVSIMNLEGERNALQERLATAEKSGRDALSGELTAANTRLKAAETELAQALATVEELKKAREAISGLELKLKSSDDENQRLNKSLVDARQSLSEANQSLSRASVVATDKSALEKANQALQQEVTSLRSQLEGANKQASSQSDAQRQLEETQVKLESAVRSFDLQNKEIEQLRKSLANIDTERESIANELKALREAPPKADPAAQAQIAQLSRDLDAAKSTAGNIQEFQSQIADLRTRLQSTETNLARANEEKDQLFKQLNLAKSDSVSPADLAKVTAELKDARDRLGAAEQALARARDDRQRAISEANQQGQQQIAQLTSELESSRATASKAEQALAELQRESETLRQQLTAAQQTPAPAAVSENSGRLRELEEALAAANQEKESLAEKLAAASSTAVAAIPSAAPPADVVSSEEDSAELRRQLDDSQGKLDAALRTFRLQQEEIDRLQAALANIDGEREQLATRLADATTRATEATTQANTHQETAAQLAGVHEQLRQAQNQIASLANENLQLKNRLSLGTVAAAPNTVSTPNPAFSAPRRPSASGTQTALNRPTQPSPTPASNVTTGAGPRTHTVAAGDTLSKISRRYYGNSERWNEILEANREIVRDARNLSVGMTLRIP